MGACLHVKIGQFALKFAQLADQKECVGHYDISGKNKRNAYTPQKKSPHYVGASKKKASPCVSGQCFWAFCGRPKSASFASKKALFMCQKCTAENAESQQLKSVSFGFVAKEINASFIFGIL